MSEVGAGRGFKHYSYIVIGDMSYGWVWMEDEYHAAPFSSGKYPSIPREKSANELDGDLDIQRDYYSDLGGEA